jgi:hypothetical protein
MQAEIECSAVLVVLDQKPMLREKPFQLVSVRELERVMFANLRHADTLHHQGAARSYDVYFRGGARNLSQANARLRRVATASGATDNGTKD